MAQRSSDLTNSVSKDDAAADRVENLTEGEDALARQTESIKARIEDTRAELGETIDAIQERLSLSNISDQVSEKVNDAIEAAKDSVYDATVGKAVDLMKQTGRIMKNTGKEISNSALAGTVKENPVPFILIGLGAGLLAVRGFSKRGNNAVQRQGESYMYDDELVESSDHRSIMGQAQEGLRTVGGSVSSAASSTYQGASRAAGSAVESVSNLARSAKSSVGDLAHRTAEIAEDLGTKAQETYTHYLEEKPWAIGAVALAAGAAIGMAIPSSRYEGELMGEARMNLLNRVQDSANGLIDKAKQAATEAGETLKSEAQEFTDKTLS